MAFLRRKCFSKDVKDGRECMCYNGCNIMVQWGIKESYYLGQYSNGQTCWGTASVQ
jgi:hypothetical protein